MSVSSTIIRELLENGAHFGHQTNKWNPKMKRFIFGEKSGIYIIDLEKTERALREAVEFLEDVSKEGKKVLFVGTKKQAKQIIKEEAERCGMYYVDERWLGGCLTNFSTIRKSVERLNNLQEMKESEIYLSLAKKERVKLEREEHKLLKNFRGIRDMTVLPGAVVVIDAEDEKIAVREANKMGIPVVAMLDTNSDPDMVDYPIPANDDAIRSIKYICSVLADGVATGRAEYDGEGEVVGKKEEPEAELESETAQAEEAPEAEEESGAEEEAAEEPVEETAEEPVEETAEEPVEETAEEPEEEKKSIADEDIIEGDISLG